MKRTNRVRKTRATRAQLVSRSTLLHVEFPEVESHAHADFDPALPWTDRRESRFFGASGVSADGPMCEIIVMIENHSHLRPARELFSPA
jgi:hypothetical protein